MTGPLGSEYSSNLHGDGSSLKYYLYFVLSPIFCTQSYTVTVLLLNIIHILIIQFKKTFHVMNNVHLVFSDTKTQDIKINVTQV